MGTVMVVGHGPSAEGQGYGVLIDRHPVVRMFNNAWQSRADYGRRYDYGLFSPPLGKYVTKPSQAWWAYDVNRERGPGFVGDESDAIDGVPVEMLRFEPWVARALAMGGKAEGRRFKLTRGCAAVCAALKLFKPTHLLLIGLDMLRAGTTVSPRYGTAAQADFDCAMAGRPHVFKPAGQAREGAHDHAVEHDLVIALAAEQGTELVWLP